MGKIKVSDKKTREILSGRNTVELVISQNATIGQIKEMLEKDVGAEARRQRIIFNGQKLSNEQTIENYNLTDNDELHLVLLERNYHDGS